MKVISILYFFGVTVLSVGTFFFLMYHYIKLEIVDGYDPGFRFGVALVSPLLIALFLSHVFPAWSLLKSKKRLWPYILPILMSLAVAALYSKMSNVSILHFYTSPQGIIFLMPILFGGYQLYVGRGPVGKQTE